MRNRFVGKETREIWGNLACLNQEKMWVENLFAVAGLCLALAFDFLLFFREFFHPAFFARRFFRDEFRFWHPIGEEGLEDGEQVGDCPIKGECGSEVIAENEEEQRHEHHQAALHRVALFWHHRHLHDASETHDDGKDVDGEAADVEKGIGLGEVVNPEEGLVAEFDGVLEHAVEAEEDGHLDEHGEAAAEGIDAVGLVHFHDLLVHFLRVGAVFLFELLHLWLELAHALHGASGFGVEWPDGGAHEERESDDGPAPSPCGGDVDEEFVEPVEGVVERIGGDAVEIVLHDFAPIAAHAAEEGVIFRADEELVVELFFLFRLEDLVGETDACGDGIDWGGFAGEGDFAGASPDGGVGLRGFWAEDGREELVTYASVVEMFGGLGDFGFLFGEPAAVEGGDVFRGEAGVVVPEEIRLARPFFLVERCFFAEEEAEGIEVELGLSDVLEADAHVEEVRCAFGGGVNERVGFLDDEAAGERADEDERFAGLGFLLIDYVVGRFREFAWAVKAEQGCGGEAVEDDFLGVFADVGLIF